MSRRKRRASWSPSSASVPGSVSNKGQGTAEDGDVEPAPPQVPQPQPSKRLPLVAAIALAVAVAAGVLVRLRAGPGYDSAAGLPVARTQEWPPNDAHGQLHVMIGKASLDAPLSDHRIVESTGDLIQSTDDAVQAGLQKERPADTSPDFFFPTGAAGLYTQSGDDNRRSGESLTRVTVMGMGLTSTRRSGEVPDRVLEPTCPTGAMTWMHADGQTLVVEEPTDPGRSTSSAPDGRVLSLPADLASTMPAGQISQRSIEKNTISVAGVELPPSRPPLESTDCCLRAPAKVEPWVSMPRCTATFPNIITAQDGEEMVAEPSCPVEDMQTEAVTAKDELPLETLPSCAVANWRSFIPKFQSLEDAGPSLLAPGHETTTPFIDLDRASLETSPPSTAAVPGLIPAETEGLEQSTRCLSPHEDALAASLLGGDEGTVQDDAALEAPLLSATAIPESTHTEAEHPGGSKRPLPTQEDEQPAAMKRGGSESTESEVEPKLPRTSVPALTGTGPTEAAAAGEPSRCPRVVLEVPFSFGFSFSERTPTEVKADAQSTCPLPLLGDEPTAAIMGPDKGMRSDEAAFKPLPPSAASTSESITAGAEERGVFTQLLPPQDESTETKMGERLISPLPLQSCPATLLGVIFAERETEAVCRSSFPAEDGPTAEVADAVEVITDADALLYRAGATTRISTTKVPAETSSTTPALAEGGAAIASMTANDETLESLSCPADVPLAIFLGEADIQTDLCPLLLADTPDSAGVLADGVSLFGTLPSWASGRPAMCTVEGAVGGEAAPNLHSERIATAAQASRNAETQGKADSRAATATEIENSQAAVEEVDQLRLEMLVREFNSWLRSMAFPVRKVEAGVVANDMRAGLIATEALADGEPYLLVPESITLDASKAREDPELGPPLARIRTHLSPIGLWDDELDSLRVLLIAETFARADRSFWAPYVRLLPTVSDMMSYHPLFFNDTVIASLEGSDVQSALRKRRYSEVEAFNSKFVDDVSAVLELEKALGEGWITLERYLWATAILDSRMIWWDGRKHLVPLLDLVNNSQGPPGTLVQETVQDVDRNAVATTTRSFETGSQVLENYGHANHVLFLYHGFSVGRENRHDCVWIAPKRLPRGPGHSLMLARMQEAFPGGRPSFCISLDKHGPYDFVLYVRIAAGLPAFPESPPVGIEPCSSRGVDELSCQWAAEDGFAERPVHERWENLRHDPQGLVAVVAYLEARLSKYPRSLVGGSDGEGGACSDGEGGSCGGSGGENAGTTMENGGDVCGAITAEEETWKFLDSEQHLLQEILDYLVAFTPGSTSSEADHQNDKAVITKGALSGNFSQEDTSGDVNKRSGYDDGNSQADPVS